MGRAGESGKTGDGVAVGGLSVGGVPSVGGLHADGTKYTEQQQTFWLTPWRPLPRLTPQQLTPLQQAV